MYVGPDDLYPNNPQDQDWLGIGDTFASPWGVAVAALTQAAVLGWAFFQLRRQAIEGIAEDVALAGHEPGEQSRLARWLGRPRRSRTTNPDASTTRRPSRSTRPRRRRGPARCRLPRWTAAFSRPATAEPRLAAPSQALAQAQRTGGGDRSSRRRGTTDATPRRSGRWRGSGHASRTRRSAPTAARRSSRRARRPPRSSRRSGCSCVLAVSLLTVRMWRLDEPYQMHFDEVYHPRTATEFLQDWRYGLSHDIYEWTHPHLAKYAMALGLVAFGEDGSAPTSQLGVPVVDATIEPRRDDGQERGAGRGRPTVGRDRAARSAPTTWRRARWPCTVAIPDAIAAGLRPVRSSCSTSARATGEIRVVDVGLLDVIRRGPPVARRVARVHGRRGPDRARCTSPATESRLAARLEAGFGTDDPASSTIVVIDAGGRCELGRPTCAASARSRRASATIGSPSPTTGGRGVHRARSRAPSRRRSTSADPSAASSASTTSRTTRSTPPSTTPEGPKVAVVIAKSGTARASTRTYTLPGDSAGRAFFDQAVADGPRRGLGARGSRVGRRVAKAPTRST